jgi:hypothetical protein
MPLPASGAISLSAIQTEFGGSNPIGINEYYRSPNGLTTTNNTNVPLSGAISFNNFYSASAEQITLSNVAISSVGGGSQTATYTLESDGDIVRVTTPLGSADIGDWISPKASAPSNYEVLATLNSGTLTSGTTGSWLALTSNRSWTLTRAIVGAADTVNLTIQIRKGSGSTLASATVTLDAERL